MDVRVELDLISVVVTIVGEDPRVLTVPRDGEPGLASGQIGRAHV